MSEIFLMNRLLKEEKTGLVLSHAEEYQMIGFPHRGGPSKNCYLPFITKFIQGITKMNPK